MGEAHQIASVVTVVLNFFLRRSNRLFARSPTLFFVGLIALSGAHGDPTLAQESHEVSGSSQALPPFVLVWPDAIENILVADAKTSTLTRFSRNNGELQTDAVYMSVGQRGVGKQREGDRRTPLGVYFITEQLDTSDLDPIYGVTAFPMDYPNARDRALGRTGGGIWLHGVPPGGERRPARDTDGCLAIPNAALSALAPMLSPQYTPIIVARSPDGDTADADLEKAARGAMIKTRLGQWLDWSNAGNIHALETLYDDAFRYQGSGKTQWLQLWADGHSRDARIEQLFVANDPEEEGLYVTRFRLKTPNYTTFKRLYWKQTSAGLKIIAEDEW